MKIGHTLLLVALILAVIHGRPTISQSSKISPAPNPLGVYDRVKLLHCKSAGSSFSKLSAVAK